MSTRKSIRLINVLLCVVKYFGRKLVDTFTNAKNRLLFHGNYFRLKINDIDFR